MKEKSKPRIMIVEDESITALSIKDSLEEMGFVVIGNSESGEDAFKLIKQDRPDLILMDITLGGRMSGIEVARKIQSCHKIPVVYLTAHSEENIFQEAKKTDPFGYLVKPFDDRDLRIAVEIALYKHQMESSLRESRKKYRALVNSAADAIYLIDAENHRISECNPGAEKMTGYTARQLKAIRIEDLHPAEEQEVVHTIFRKIEKMGSLTGITGINHINMDGQSVPVEFNASKIRLGNREFITGIFRDITLRKRIEDVREKERTRLTGILDSMEDCVYIADHRYRIEYMNPSFRKKFNAVQGRRCLEVFHGRNMTCPMCTHKETFDGRTVRWEWTHSKSGKCFDIIDTPLKNADGSISKLAILRDITERKKTEERIREASITDGLTGLLNRHGFFTLAAQQLKLARRTGKKLSLVYLDLDNLKEINDTLGHKAGDRALTDAADILRRTFREADIAARIGGDEYAVLLTDGLEPGGDETVVSHLQANLDRHNESGGRPFSLSISSGIASFDPASPCFFDELLNRADILMYNKKMQKKTARGMAQVSVERRIYRRIKAGREFTAELDPAIACAVKDLSAGGMCIEASERHDAGTVRKIKILRDNREVTICTATPVWSAAGAEGKYLTGFKFINLNDRAKGPLVRLISEFGIRDAVIRRS